VYANYLAADDDVLREVTWRYLTKWMHIKPHTAGDELRAQGLQPGPAYRRILDMLRGAWLDDKISTIEEEKQLLKHLLAETEAEEPI
jgi:hypothetical protein